MISRHRDRLEKIGQAINSPTRPEVERAKAERVIAEHAAALKAEQAQTEKAIAALALHYGRRPHQAEAPIPRALDESAD
jgi:hypothetical protein